MVIDITENYNRCSIDETINQFMYSLNEFCNETCMSIMLDKYEYLKETGELFQRLKKKKIFFSIFQD